MLDPSGDYIDSAYLSIYSYKTTKKNIIKINERDKIFNWKKEKNYIITNILNIVNI